jgi:hypothetical protein
MKQLEKLVGVTGAEVRQALPALREASVRMAEDYDARTHPKLRMLDALIGFSLATFIVQIVYA